MQNNSPPTEDKKSGLLRASGTVSGMTLISRILGFLRDVVIARIFGADMATDAFFIAFKIPNFFRRLFAEGAFSQAFVPVFAEYKQTRSPEALKDLVAHVSGALGSILLGITTLGLCAAPLIIMIFAPGFINDTDRFTLAKTMLLWTFPYLLFISLVALAGGVLNSFQRFAVPAITPVFLNISLILCAIWLSPYLNISIMALAIGVFIAGIVQLLFQLPFLQKLGLLQWPKFRWQHPGVQKIIKLMLPAMLGSAVVQINLLFDTLIASLLVAGSVSWLYFADRLVEFPLGVFGIAIATVILPSLSKKHADANAEKFSQNLDWGLRSSVLIAMPAMLGLILLAEPLIIALFQYGAFSSNDSLMASYALIAYALGLPAFILVKILAPAFFARQDTRTPVKIAIYAMVCNMLLNIILVTLLIRLEFSAVHAGLALATASSAWVQTILLYRRLRQDNVYSPEPHWRKFLLQIFCGLAVMAIALFYSRQWLDQWAHWLFWERGLAITALVGIGAISYFLVIWLAGIRLQQFRGYN